MYWACSASFRINVPQVFGDTKKNSQAIPTSTSAAITHHTNSTNNDNNSNNGNNNYPCGNRKVQAVAPTRKNTRPVWERTTPWTAGANQRVNTVQTVQIHSPLMSGTTRPSQQFSTNRPVERSTATNRE